MNTTRKSLRRDLDEKATDRLIERVSPANREFVRRIVRQKRNEGLREPTSQNWARALLRLDEQLERRAYVEATPDALGGVLERLRRVMERDSLRQFSIHLKAAYRDILNVDVLPRAYNQALKVRQDKWSQAKKMAVAARVVSDEHFQALLEQAESDAYINRLGMPNRITGIALLWTLRDSAFRADEQLSLSVGDIRPRGASEVNLVLREEAPALGQGEHKTGPRIVPGAKCAGALKALLAIHPFAGDPDAPLFLKFRAEPGNGVEGQRLRYESLRRWLKHLAKQAGLPRIIKPHDLRHTRLTEISHVMREEDQRVFAGWAPGSKMPSVYNHVKFDDLIDAVRRDAGITALGHANVAQPDKAEALAALLSDLLLERQKKERSGRKAPSHKS